ncbi:MAG TPA: nucleotide sugar dehydrogenase, partial [Acidobacteriota bacterium]|nr:nucleotide sugar dehydrogenase [Acidobacteriota bacterium]
MKVAVIGGCGHVGLPLALALVTRGHHVDVLDIDAAAIARIQAGEMPFMEQDGAELLRQALDSGRFRCHLDPACLADAEAVILITGTPVDEYMNPRQTLVFKVLAPCLPHFRDGQTLILRSTLFPGMTERVARYLEKNRLNLHVAFCPERVAEGRAIREMCSLPQIIAALSPEGREVSARLFATLTPTLIHLEPLEAELTKLFSNVYRYIHFAIPNQFYMICREHGIDYEKIHHALTFEYPRAAHLPKPGLTAGPCLLKDTLQLAAFQNLQFPLGQAACHIHEGMPNFLIQILRRKMDLANLNAGLLGVAFKADSDDARSSLGGKLRKLLALECRAVRATDPYVKDPSLVDAAEVIRESDFLVLGTPHRCYRELDLQGKPVLDMWQFYPAG